MYDMKKKEILKNYTINKLGEDTIMITGKSFMFSYTKSNSICKDEYKDQYRYFGGLQCEYVEGSNNYKELEKWLCEIVEKLI